MLIFFIVTSSFVKEPGVELFKPQASTQEACERGTIILLWMPMATFSTTKTSFHWIARLRTAEAAKKEAPQANIVVQVDRETPAYVVEDLIDIVRPVLTSPPCISTDEEA